MSQEEVLRILHLEDDPADSEVVRQFLHRDGLAVQIDRVATLAQFRDALEHGAHTLILADYTVPGVDPLEALKLAHRQRSVTPFIFVSGTLGEERAVETLKLGATDYVLKQHLQRLAPAVRRALEEAEAQARRRQEEEGVLEQLATLKHAEAVQQYFRAFFESAPGLYLVLMAQENYRIVAVSEAYLRATMTQRREIMGKDMFEVFPDKPGDPSADGVRNLRASFERVRHERRADVMAVQRYPIRRPASEGGGFEERWWSPINSPVFGLAGQITYIIHRVEDVTPFLLPMREQGKEVEGRRLVENVVQHMGLEIVLRSQELARLNEELREAYRSLEALTKQLQASNSALQDFAAIASHDLQEPLRKIMTYGDKLRRKHGGALPAEAQDYLHRMMTATGRMQDLINDLLTYSRVTTKAQPYMPVDLQRVAAEVLEDLESRIESTRARVEAESLPTIEADPTQMRQLLQNLIGNALKFTPPGATPHVRIYSHSGADGTTQIFVEDRGIGFDEKYLDRIFGVFQRLQGRSVYEGTGMGLAICRKIAERHGGLITARSRPGEGSTFIVTLPLRQRREEGMRHAA